MDRRTRKPGSFVELAGSRTPDPKLIHLPKRPLSPWLRLAHVWTVRPQDATHRGRLRTLHDFELFFQIEASTWIYSEPHGGSVDLRAGEIAFIPPGFVHAWGHELGRHIAVHFDLHARPEMTPANHLELTDTWVSRSPLAHVPRFAVDAPLRTAVAPPLVLPLVTKLRSPRLWHERLGILVSLWSERDTRSLSAGLAASEIIGWALRTIAEDHARTSDESSTRTDTRILELVRALDLDPSSAQRRLSVSDLAGRARMSVTAFRAAFFRTMGRPPGRYLEERRIERAARALIETDLKILRIAEAEGYGDPYHFSRVFRRVMGISPRQYRRKASGRSES